MELQIVSYKLAKKLKEIGFPQTSMEFPTNQPDVLYKDGIIRGFWHNTEPYNRICLMPTQALAQMWFRERHNIDIKCSCNYERNMWNFGYRKKGYSYNHYPLEFKSYEEALEAGLLKACEII